MKLTDVELSLLIGQTQVLVTVDPTFQMHSLSQSKILAYKTNYLHPWLYAIIIMYMQRVHACFLCFSGVWLLETFLPQAWHLEQLRILLGWYQYQVDRWSVLAWVDLVTLSLICQTWCCEQPHHILVYYQHCLSPYLCKPLQFTHT